MLTETGYNVEQVIKMVVMNDSDASVEDEGNERPSGLSFYLAIIYHL